MLNFKRLNFFRILLVLSLVVIFSSSPGQTFIFDDFNVYDDFNGPVIDDISGSIWVQTGGSSRRQAKGTCPLTIQQEVKAID
jgi:hypothetical protein